MTKEERSGAHSTRPDVEEVVGEARRGPKGWLEDLFYDLRYAARLLRRTPGFAAVVVATLGLGIGACAAIFSVVNHVLLRALPLPDAERIVVVREQSSPAMPQTTVASGKYLGWQKEASSFESMGALTGMSYNLTEGGDTLHLYGARMTASLLTTLRLNPVIGRNFSVQEELPNGQENVAILSYSLWQEHFGGRPDVMNRPIQLNGRPITVVGVLPRESALPERVAIFTPLAFSDGDRRNFGYPTLHVVGRLKEGVPASQAEAEMKLIAQRLPTSRPIGRDWVARATPIYESVVGNVRPVLLSLLGAVVFLLLIACANVANLLLARGSTRSKEIALRASVGATRARIVRQLLGESLLMSFLGGALGVVLAKTGLEALLAMAPEALPRAVGISIDGRALGFAACLVLLTGVGFGLLPAVQATRVDLNSTLRQAGRGASEGPRVRKLRGALVVIEVAVATVLLTGCGLLMRSFAQLQEVDPGFNPRGLHVAEVYLPRPQYTDGSQYVNFAERSLAAIAGQSGVETVAVASNVPFTDHHLTAAMSVRFGVPGFTAAGAADLPVAAYYTVSAKYFEAMGLSLLRGRAFDGRDAPGGARVAIVSESLAKTYFPDGAAVGKVLHLFGSAPREIVGVAGDIKHPSMESGTALQIYEPFPQVPDNDIIYVIRTRAGQSDAAIATAVGSAVQSVDSKVPIYNARPFATMIGLSIARQRFATTLFGVFSGIAMLLAAIGIYGVMAYSAAQRTPEIGIRRALGASSASVVGLLLGQGTRLIAIGLVGGGAGSFLLTRFLKTMLFEVTAYDPLTFSIVAMLFASIGVLACLLPAFRACRIKPMLTLRAE